MFTRLRIGATNLIARVAIRAFWLGKRPNDLEIVNQTMPVESGRIHLRIYKPRGAGPFPVVLFSTAAAGYLAIWKRTTLSAATSARGAATW